MGDSSIGNAGHDVVSSGRPSLLRELLPDRLEAAVLLILVTAASYQLFVEPVVGVADNRDFARLMDPVGLDYQSVADYKEAVFQFVETKFIYAKIYSHRYLTSQKAILGIARVFNRVLSKDGKFDIRVLGFCNLALYAAAVFALLRGLRDTGTARRIFAYAAVLVICTDVRLIAYFNSFYCESASLIFLLATVGLAFLCIQSGRRGPKSWLLWAGYMASATFFWMAKSQNAAFVPCLALGAWCFFPTFQFSRRSYVRLMAVAALPVAVVLAFSLGAYGKSVSTNAQVVVDEEILPNSPQPAVDLQELRPNQANPTLVRIAGFYLRHPGRWWRMAARDANACFGYLQLGNFTRSSGLGPGAQSQSFNVWSEFKKKYFPRNLILLVALLAGYFLLAAIRSRAGRDERMRILLGPVLGLACALEFIITVTFEANGTVKHLFIFNVAVDLCLLMALLDVSDVVARIFRDRFVATKAEPRAVSGR